MKSVKVTGIRHVELFELPTPEVNPGQALVDMVYSGICGSDMHFYQGHHPSIKPPTNFIQGHESVGIIREINGADSKFKVGDKVAINPLVGCGECFNCQDNQPNICRVSRKVMGFRLDGTMCESFSVGLEQLILLDNSIDMKLAAMIEPFAVGYHAVSLVHYRDLVNTPVIVTGGGTIGVMTALVLKYIHHASPFIIEKDPQRIALLQRMGFDMFSSIDEIDALNLRQRPIAFECTGYYPVLENLVAANRKPEQIVIIGQYAAGSTIGLHEIMSSEITITSSHMYNSDDLEKSAAAIMQTEVANELQKIVYSKVYALEDAAEAFNQATSGKLDGKLKVLIGNSAQ